MTPRDYRDFAVHIAQEAGNIVRSMRGKAAITAHKTHFTDFVTQADLESEKYLIQAIKHRFPTHQIISEEDSVQQSMQEEAWVIDPLDGTLNFATGIPLYGVMVAFFQRHVCVASAIVLPEFDETYSACVNEPATCNGKTIRCGTNSDFDKSVGHIGSSSSNRKIALLQRVNARYPQVWVNSFGCAAYAICAVASGKRDWLVAHGKLWDSAAGSLILSQAGCVVTDCEGEPWTWQSTSFRACTPGLVSSLNEFTRGL